MEDLTRIYSRNLFFTASVFAMGLMIPYAKGNTLAVTLLILLAIILYCYIGKLLVEIIMQLSKRATSIKELKFLFITLAVLCAGGYFFIGVVDSAEKMISNLRHIKTKDCYNLLSIDGFLDYFLDLILTYLNSLYYSIVVMATLGDSKIIAEGIFTRIIIVFEVGTALSLTIFKIGEFFSERSSAETKKFERRILNEVQKINPSYIVDPKAGFWERTFMKLTIRARRRRKSLG